MVVMFVGVAFVMSVSRSYKYVYRKGVFIDVASSSLPDGVDAAAVRPDSNAVRLNAVPPYTSPDDITVPFYIYPKSEQITNHVIQCMIDEDQLFGGFSSPASQWSGSISMYMALRNSPWRTYDPEKADIFYVPLLYKDINEKWMHKEWHEGGDNGTRKAGCYRRVLDEHPDLFSLNQTMREDLRVYGKVAWSTARWLHFEAFVTEMESMPYAARYGGVDHAIANTHHNINIAHARLSNMIRRGIIFVASYRVRSRKEVTRAPECRVLIPYPTFPDVAIERIQRYPLQADLLSKTGAFAYFRGKGQVRNNEAGCWKCTWTSPLVREKLANISITYPEYNWSATVLGLKGRGSCEQRGHCSNTDSGYSPSFMAKEMAEATFCFVPMGDTPDSQRLLLAIRANCIPVIIARHYNTYSGEPMWYAPFQGFIDYSRFAIFVDPIEFVVSDDRYLPDLLQSIASNTTRMSEMLYSVSEMARHLTFEAPGSDVWKYALMSAQTHCLSRPVDHIPTPEEHMEPERAGVMWANHDDTEHRPWEFQYLVSKDEAASQIATMCRLMSEAIPDADGGRSSKPRMCNHI